MKNNAFIIKGGNVVDPSSGKSGAGDVYILNGRISAELPEGAEIVDAAGKTVCPGLVDMHAHLREPGREDKETIETACMAAARGGYTTIVAMPNTAPPADSAAVITYVINKSLLCGKARVLPAGSVSKGLDGRELSDMGELVAAGACAVTDDGRPVMNSALMRKALEYSQIFDIPVISHCEDITLSEGVMNEGQYSTMLGLTGTPACAEEIMAARDIMLAALTGGRLHIAHVSTKGCVELIREAKRRGVKVTAEATPHHFSLTDKEVLSFDTNFRMSPPLRSEEDVEAVRAGLKDGTIDAIATDHAPHTSIEKEEEFAQAPPGVTGLETALSAVITNLVNTGLLSLSEAIAKMTMNPAGILKTGLGTLSPGSPADVCVFDAGKKWTVCEDSFFSLSKNSAFIGRELCGVVETVFFGGRPVFDRGKFV